MAKQQKLTEKQRRFADYYLELGNIVQACIKAGYSTTYANAQGYKLLENVGIKAYLEKRLDALASQRIADATEVMQYLTSVMRREHQESVVVTITEERSAYEPDVNGVVRKVSQKKEAAEIVEIPAKLSDANKAAELLGKRLGLFRDGIDVAGDLTLQVTMDYGQPQSVANRVTDEKLHGFSTQEQGGDSV